MSLRQDSEQMDKLIDAKDALLNLPICTCNPLYPERFAVYKNAMEELGLDPSDPANIRFVLEEAPQAI